MWEVSKSFWFEAAHTLRREIGAESSARIHGHSYQAEVTLRGTPQRETGMLIDFGVFETALGAVRDALDHRLLDDVADLGPATMENLSAWIWRRLAPGLPALSAVTVRRPSSGETCRYLGLGDTP